MGVVEIVRAFELEVVARGKPFRSAVGSLLAPIRTAVLVEKAADERKTTRAEAALWIVLRNMIPELMRTKSRKEDFNDRLQLSVDL